MTPAVALAALRAAEAEDGAPDLAARRAALERLRAAVLRRAEDAVAAADADFGGRAAEDTLLADVLVVAEAARYAARHLRRWAKPQRVSVPLPFLPARAWVEYVPKGVVGVMAPWNYPLQLALVPALEAVAAGNRVCLKPSEATPRVAALLGEIVAEAWGPRMGLVVQGGVEVARDFATQPWDHLVFTGGTETGRRVMAAAAANLTPLTLELGGKCPSLVLPGADLREAARAILAAKAVNAGQTCIAPDTVLLVGHRAADFHAACRATGIGAAETSVINPAQGARLERIAGGTETETLGEGTTPLRLAPAQGALAAEEIFGPVLAVEECADLPAALRWIAARPHPLAIALFGATRAEEEAVAAGTKSGALVVGRAMEHAAMPGLPFGGVGASGFGRRGGEAGFREFSNPRARVRHGRVALARLLDPPRGDFARKLARRLVGLKP
ncbi:aldehyde dehydrogenase family protein [Sabulicella rubraurantiaca]|uniref:aldehyde dehydrogenase family protein n=1 Tax=Sabulicella rubraurantiaca TaxID=2811429 RepID=UPI001A956FB3|nr:aldehyde dehydrogenase family protein [Sabulicella rubraurantiaca]